MTGPQPRDGVFVPRHALVVGSCAIAGLLVTILVLVLPQIGVAVGSGLATAGLIYTIATTWKNRR